MPDKKLTDSEIVKALECCSINKKCTGCYFNTHETDDMCPRVLMRNALDLINRLQIENKNLEEKNSNLISHLTSLQNNLTSARAEVESLKDLILKKCCDNCIHKEKTLRDFPCCECFGYRNFIPKNLLKTIKAEAYKEFAERLIEKYGYYDWENKTIVYPEDEINNLLKELVGEGNESKN